MHPQQKESGWIAGWGGLWGSDQPVTTLKTGYKCYSTMGKGETDLEEDRYLVSVGGSPSLGDEW